MNKERYERELQEIQRIRTAIDESGLVVAEGKLRCEMAQGKYPQFYLVSEKLKEYYPHGKYLKSDELETARKYSQNEYNVKVRKVLDNYEKAIMQLLKLYQTSLVQELYGVYDKTPQAKQSLITPWILNEDDYIAEWKRKNPGQTNKTPLENGFKTELGELVRSKSEKMIADKFNLNRIPYVYEPQLRLKKNVVVCPDFLLLNKRSHEEFYLEHFGMMDNPEYCKKALQKIELYEENHIYLGQRLFATFESSIKPINMNQIDTIINMYLV